MAAILHPAPPIPAHRPRPIRWPAPTVARPRPQATAPSAAVYRRRRIVAALVALALLAGVVALGRAALTTVSVLPPPAAAPPSRAEVVVVRPGDTLWSIAERLEPEGDVRPVVDRLVAAHGAGPLQVGEEIPVGGLVER